MNFTFGPEDSFWNESSSGSALFSDSRTAAVARQALDDLFELNVGKKFDEISVTESEQPLSEFDAELSIAGNRTKELPKPIVERKSLEKRIIDNENASVDGREILNSSAISEYSGGSRTSDAAVYLDYSRLKAEHRKLQKYLDRVRNERFEALPVRETIKKLASCRKVALDFYRSKEQKLELLAAALESSNADVILTVVLFLKRTLIPSIFREILITNTLAADVYITYLRECGDHQKLCDTLFALGRTDEGAMIEFALACRERQNQHKIAKLKRCLLSGMSNPSMSRESQSVAEYIDLMERQIAIEGADNDNPSELFDLFPTDSSLIGQSLLKTLYYCFTYHYGLPANSYASPAAFKLAFNVSEKEFAWIAFIALSRQRKYAEIDQILTTKKFISSETVCPIEWADFFNILSNNGHPPLNMLNKWLKAVPNLDQRFMLADQFGDVCRELQLETAVTQKDRKKVAELMKRLTPNSAIYLKAQTVLSNSSTRWKNQ